MAEMSESSRWEKELAQFDKVLAEPTGQAIVIVGTAGSGKSTLLRRMLMRAEKGEKFHCEGKIHLVGPGDHPNDVLRDIGKWSSGVVAHINAKSVLERLSESVEEFGDLHRRVVGVNANPTQPAEFERWWLQIIPELPPKVKFIFTQRPDGILVNNKQFMNLPNVVRINLEAPSESDEEESARQKGDSEKEGRYENERQLMEAFVTFLAKEKGYPDSSMMMEEADGGRRIDLAIVNQVKEKQLAIVKFGLDEDNVTFQKGWEHFMYANRNASVADIEGYIVFPDEAQLGEEFSIFKFNKQAPLWQAMLCADFPHYEDFRPPEEAKREASGGEGGDNGRGGGKTRISESEILEKVRRVGSRKLPVLDLSSCDLREVPEEVCALEGLEILDLRLNKLTSLPKNLGQLKDLRELNVRSNLLKTIPREIGQLSNLTKLYLHNNRIESLPKEMAQLTELRELLLGYNKLTSIPAEFCKLKNLDVLDLSANEGLISPPPDVVGRGQEAVLAYLREQLERGVGETGEDGGGGKGVRGGVMEVEDAAFFKSVAGLNMGDTPEAILREALESARNVIGEIATVTTSHVLFSIAKFGARGGPRYNTCRFVKERAGQALERVKEDYYQLQRERLGRVQVTRAGKQPVVLVTNYVLATLKEAAQIAGRTTGGNTIHVRHLVAGLLLSKPGTEEPGARLRLREMEVDIQALKDDFLVYLNEQFKRDRLDAWERILKAATMPPEKPAEEPKGPLVELLSMHVKDQASEEDWLGFEPYVEAVAHFLTNPQTEAPLTLSIEGEWGYGKSSFMLQVEKEIRAEKKKEIRAEQNKSLLKRLTTIVKEAGKLGVGLASVSPRTFHKKAFGQVRKAWAYVVGWIEGPKGSKEFTVRFNAWRHDKEDAVWGAFALEFLEQMSGQRRWIGRRMAYLRLCRERYDWKTGGLPAFRFLAAWVLLISLSLSILIVMGREGAAVMKTIAEKLTESGLWQKVLGKALSTGGYAGSIGLIVVLWSKAKDYIGNPLRIELKKYVQSPDYKNKVSFIERFHKDFAKIVRAYSGGKTVYVFIDDVDRCEVPKAAELMQSLNLLIANDPQLIFIIGMDREKVAAGLAVKFKELLPYLANSDQKTGIAGASGASRIHEIEYGYNFIEKFVQVPFVIPRPKEENLRRFLERIGRTARYVIKAPEISVPEGDEETGPEREAEIDKGVRIKTKPVETETARAEGVAEATEAARKVKEKAKREEVRMRFDQEFDRTPEIVLKVNPALESNPRRVKQFINLFRLWAYIAITTGVIDPEQRSWKAEDWTFEKLGKLIAVRLRWPLLLAELDKAPEMLGELEQAAWRPAVRKSAKVGASNISQWIERQELMELLRAGCFRENGKADTKGRKVHSVGKLDLGKLLLVSPRIRNLWEEMKGTEIEMEKILTEPGGRSLVSVLRRVLRSGAEST